jgi:hypothetical protein
MVVDNLAIEIQHGFIIGLGQPLCKAYFSVHITEEDSVDM